LDPLTGDLGRECREHDVQAVEDRALRASRHKSELTAVFFCADVPARVFMQSSLCCFALSEIPFTQA
jgi:hypothetical protein